MINTTTFIAEGIYANAVYSMFEYDTFGALVIWSNVYSDESYPKMKIIKADDYFDDLFRNHRNMSYEESNENEDEDEDEESENFVDVCFGEDLNRMLVNSLVNISRKGDAIDKNIFCKNFNRFLSRLVNHQTATGGWSQIDYKNEISYDKKSLINLISLINFELNKDEIDIINIIKAAINESINALDIEVSVNKFNTYIDMIDAIGKLIIKDDYYNDATVACINKDGNYIKDYGNNEVSRYAPNNMTILKHISKIPKAISKLNHEHEYISVYNLQEIASRILFKNKPAINKIYNLSKEEFALLLERVNIKEIKNKTEETQLPF